MISNDLARAIDGVQRALLLDAANEETDPVAAAGYQWLAENGKWPAHMAGYGWDWLSGRGEMDADALPSDALESCPEWHAKKQEKPTYRESPSTALAWAALCVGLWLQKQKTRGCEACGGTGEVYAGREADDDEYACSTCNRPAGVYGHEWRDGVRQCPKEKCKACSPAVQEAKP